MKLPSDIRPPDWPLTIRELQPDARIFIMMLRNPVEVIRSHHRQLLKVGMEYVDEEVPQHPLVRFTIGTVLVTRRGSADDSATGFTG